MTFHNEEEKNDLISKLTVPSVIGNVFAGAGGSFKGKTKSSASVASTSPASSGISSDEAAFNKKFAGSKSFFGGILMLIGFQRIKAGIGAAKLRQVVGRPGTV